MKKNMNMNRHTTLKLFLLTATAAVFNNASAFVVPSASTAVKRQATVAPMVINNQVIDDVPLVEEDEEDHLGFFQSAIDVMDRLQKGDTKSIPKEHFDADTVKSRKPVCTEMEDESLDAAALKELAESEESNNALDRPIDFLKNLMKGYRYIKRADGKIEYTTYPRHYDVSKVKYIEFRLIRSPFCVILFSQKI